MSKKVFILPGLYNSGPDHWQTYWESEHGFERINQDNWETPVKDEWIKRIDETVTKFPLGNVVLIGHSLACSTVAWWAAKYNRKIHGALLVGPSDTECDIYPPGTSGFMPMPLNQIPFRTIIIASTNDEYVSVARAQQFAKAWGSELVMAGALGHINSASKLESWEFGYNVLKNLIES
ncbi:MAG: alpha/beta hydrolase [Bacteroidetes bacterium]|nr:MAG: alpha/beta hydrolase [Bacteroidota bacterium]